MTPETLRIFRRHAPVSVLGPFQRAVIWVQGCAFACPGCIVPESWDAKGGDAIPIADLVDWVLAQSDLEGITVSGGEPMMQAPALVALIDGLRQVNDLGVVCYTGDRLERLQEYGTEAQQELLDRVDLLIDGTYVEALHQDLLWRGSSNQRLLLLTKRYQQILAGLADRSAGLEVYLDEAGVMALTGVPNRSGFRAEFEAGMARQGIILTR